MRIRMNQDQSPWFSIVRIPDKMLPVPAARDL